MNIEQVTAADNGERQQVEVPGVADHILDAEEAVKWRDHLSKEIGSGRISLEWEERLTERARTFIDHFYQLVPECLDQFVVEALGQQWAILGGFVGPERLDLDSRQVIKTIDALLPHVQRITDPHNPGEVMDLILAECKQPEVVKAVLDGMQWWLRMEVELNEREPEELCPVVGVTLITMRAVEPELRRCLVSD